MDEFFSGAVFKIINDASAFDDYGIHRPVGYGNGCPTCSPSGYGNKGIAGFFEFPEHFVCFWCDASVFISEGAVDIGEDIFYF